MKVNTKILAVAIVAMFCATAFATVATEDSDADTYKYRYYFQLKDDTIGSSIKSWWGSYDADTKSQANFAKGLEEALDGLDYDYLISDTGWITSIEDFKEHGNWDPTATTSNFYTFTVYYADGDSWNLTKTYDEGTTFAIVFDKVLCETEYNKLSADDRGKYLWDGLEKHAMMLPSDSPSAWENAEKLLMIIGIVVLVVIIAVIVVVVLLVIKSKKKTA